METALSSQDMPPPGFENFKPSRLRQSSLPVSAGSKYSPVVTNINEVAVKLVEKAWSVPAARNWLPKLESGAGGSLFYFFIVEPSDLNHDPFR